MAAVAVLAALAGVASIPGIRRGLIDLAGRAPVEGVDRGRDAQTTFWEYLAFTSSVIAIAEGTTVTWASTL